MLEKIIGAMQDAIRTNKQTFFELKQEKDAIYLVSRDLETHRFNYQMKLEYRDKKELCDQIYLAITSEVVKDPCVNFINHLCSGFGDTIHTDLWIELNEAVSFAILDNDCNFQDWILEMKDKNEVVHKSL